MERVRVRRRRKRREEGGHTVWACRPITPSTPTVILKSFLITARATHVSMHRPSAKSNTLGCAACAAVLRTWRAAFEFAAVHRLVGIAEPRPSSETKALAETVQTVLRTWRLVCDSFSGAQECVGRAHLGRGRGAACVMKLERRWNSSRTPGVGQHFSPGVLPASWNSTVRLCGRSPAMMSALHPTMAARMTWMTESAAYMRALPA